eukprot:tig00020941_g16226.t1
MRKPMWFCTNPHCHEDKRFPGNPQAVMETRKPSTVLKFNGMHQAEFEPVSGAPESEQPLYYSRICGHQLYPGEKAPDGGDPACFEVLFNRLGAFSEQLRVAGHVRAAAGVLLQLAASLADFRGDRTLLCKYEADCVYGFPWLLSCTRGDRLGRAVDGAEHVANALSGLCIIAVDERLGAQQRDLLAAAALEIADSFGLRHAQDRATSREESNLPAAHPLSESECVLGPDAMRSVVLRKAARVLIRATRMARTPWDHPLVRVALAGETSSNCVHLLRLEPPLDLETRCRYLLEQGRFHDCVKLSRAGGVASTLLSALQELGGPPEDSVTAVLELVDTIIPLLFEAAVALSAGRREWPCLCGISTSTDSSSPEADRAVQHNMRCTLQRYRSILDASHPPADVEHHQWKIVIQDSLSTLGRTVEALRQQRADAGDERSNMWLSLAVVALSKIGRSHVSNLDDADLFRLVVRCGLALRSAPPPNLSPPYASPERESAEALRLAGLPLAEAFAACAQRPDAALEAALVRLARTGLLPCTSTEADHRAGGERSSSTSSSKEDASPLRPRSWCAPLQDAGLGALAARFYLHSTNLTSVCSDDGGYNAAEPEPHDSYLSRIGDALFGPMPPEASAAAMATLSALGECEPASVQQYETLLLACALRLDTLGHFDDALRLVTALLELESNDEGTDARRALCRDLLIKARVFGSQSRFVHKQRAPLIQSARLDVLLAFFGSGASDRAFRDLDVSFLLRLAGTLLRSHLAAEGGSVLCKDGIVIGQGEGIDAQLEAAAATLVAVSRERENSGPGSVARIVLQLLAKAGRAVKAACLSAVNADWSLRYATLLGASGEMESAAPLAFSAMLGSRHPKHYDFALRFLEGAAPHLAELWGISADEPVLLRRRILGRFLGEFEDDVPVLDDHGDPWGSYGILVQRILGWKVEPVGDYLLLAKHFDLASFSVWRRVLGEIHARELFQADNLPEEDRADALRLAELIWKACPCVQALWVIRGALSAADRNADAGEEAGASYGAWLQTRLGELKENVRAIFTGELPPERKRIRVPGLRGCEIEADEEPYVSEECRRTARLVLAAGALLLGHFSDRDDEDSEDPERAHVEAALELNTKLRTAGGVAAMVLLARWCKVAEIAAMHVDNESLGYDEHADSEWRGVENTKQVFMCFGHYITAATGSPYGEIAQVSQALASGRPWLDLGVAPGLGVGFGVSPLALDPEEGCGLTAEELKELAGAIGEHQRRYGTIPELLASLGLARECERRDCRLCRGALHCRGRRFYSLGLLGSPVLRLVVETILRFPLEEGHALHGVVSHAIVAAYSLRKARAIAAALRGDAAPQLSDSDRAGLAQSARKTYIVARTLIGELSMSFETPRFTRAATLNFARTVAPAFRCADALYVHFLCCPRVLSLSIGPLLTRDGGRQGARVRFRGEEEPEADPPEDGEDEEEESQEEEEEEEEEEDEAEEDEEEEEEDEGEQGDEEEGEEGD